jgi:hypothetical protein
MKRFRAKRGLIALILVLALVAAVAYYVWDSQKPTATNKQFCDSGSVTYYDKNGSNVVGQDCSLSSSNSNIQTARQELTGIFTALEITNLKSQRQYSSEGGGNIDNLYGAVYLNPAAKAGFPAKAAKADSLLIQQGWKSMDNRTLTKLALTSTEARQGKAIDVEFTKTSNSCTLIFNIDWQDDVTARLDVNLSCPTSS